MVERKCMAGFEPSGVLAGGFVRRAFERIGWEVDELRQALEDERLLPDFEPLSPLLGQHDCPTVAPEAEHIATIREVKEFAARPFVRLAAPMKQKVVGALESQSSL